MSIPGIDTAALHDSIRRAFYRPQVISKLVGMRGVDPDEVESLTDDQLDALVVLYRAMTNRGVQTVTVNHILRFALSNREHVSLIVELVLERRLMSIKDLAAIIANSQNGASALSEGTL